MFGAPLRAPRGALPLPMRRSARPQGGAALPPPLGAGVRFIPSGCSHTALPSSSPPRRGLPSFRRFARPVAGERYAFAPRFAPRFAWFFHFLAAVAAAVRRRRRGGVTPRPRRARSPSRWRAPVCPLSCPMSFLPFGNVPAECYPMRHVTRFARCLARRVRAVSRVAAFPAALRAQGGVYAPAPRPRAGGGMRERG